ncbi:hypothetical protein ENSA5_30850 [Enhygromyxa salina]|uniref:Uncharacterized protein n=1 Tax=Enhygromyxa salina TaxID=215803 RepID=A0A2S9XZE7_9BACT|nr:hypothetical protein [Enhygromyxa salina]PRP98100.1 hypothetical protein ENSA5_30850 [Enhygromyxa salina]
MKGPLLVSALVVGSCQAAGPRTDAPAGDPGPRDEGVADRGADTREPAAPRDPDVEPPLRCSMAGQACPSAGLPRFGAQLDAEGWTRLRALAGQGLVAVVLAEDGRKVEKVELDEGCRPPGRYHEAVAAPESPGRAWASDRLAFAPDELGGCARATHFVASFAVRGDADGEAVALPLPCPPLGSGTPRACIGAGLDDPAREALARSKWALAEPLIEREDWAGFEAAVAPLVELAALMPSAWSYEALAGHLRFLDHERHGGCLWSAEASFAAQALRSGPGAEPRVAPDHEHLDCETRPSLLTCFPERFTPGTGDNCW